MARKKGLGRSGIPASSTTKKLPTLDDTDDRKDDLHAHGGTGLHAASDAGEAGAAGPEEQGFVLDEVPLMEQGIVLGEIPDGDGDEEETHRDRREEKDPDYAPGMRTGRKRGGMDDDDEDWDAGEEGEVVVNPENRRHLKSTHAVQKKNTNAVVVTQKEIDEYFDELPHLPLNKNGGLTCKFCGEKLSRRFDVKRHCLNVHLERRNFVCQHCGDKFKRDAHLVAHIGSVHEGVSYKCKVCGQMFASESNRMRHHRVLHAGGSGSGRKSRSTHKKKNADGAGPSNAPVDEDGGEGDGDGDGEGDGEEDVQAGDGDSHNGEEMVEGDGAGASNAGEEAFGKDAAQTKPTRNPKDSNKDEKPEAGEGGFEIIQPTGVELPKPSKKPKGKKSKEGEGAAEDGADRAIVEAKEEGKLALTAAPEHEGAHPDEAAGNEKSKKKKDKGSKVATHEDPAGTAAVGGQASADHADSDEAAPKEKRKRGRPAKEETAAPKAEKHEEPVVEPGAGVGVDDAEPDKKRKRGRPSKASKEGHEAGDTEPAPIEHEATETAAAPKEKDKEKEKKKRGRPSKADRSAAGAHHDGEEEEEHMEIVHEEGGAADAASSSRPPIRESEPMEQTSAADKPEDELPFI